jgi:hypothetical protein
MLRNNCRFACTKVGAAKSLRLYLANRIEREKDLVIKQLTMAAPPQLFELRTASASPLLVNLVRH